MAAGNPGRRKTSAPIHQVNTYASASTAADAERVYVYFVGPG